MRTEAQGKTPPLPPKTKFTWFALNLIRKHKEEERIKEDTVIEKKNKEGEIFTCYFLDQISQIQPLIRRTENILPEFGPAVHRGQHLKEYQVIDSQTFSGACLFQRVPCCILKSNGPRSIYTQRSFYLFRSLLCFDSPFPTSIYFFLVHFAFDFVARRYLVSLHKPPPCIRFDFFFHFVLFPKFSVSFFLLVFYLFCFSFC